MSNSNQAGGQPIFEGEEAGAGYANPMLDMIASAVLLIIAAAFMAGSLALPVPGSVTTAPGLLPFLTAASMALMAIGLAVSAFQRQRRLGHTMPIERDVPTERRTLALAVSVLIYICALQFLSFRQDFVIGSFRFVLSAFEPVTILVLVALMQIFWRGALWKSLVIAVVWTLFLSLVFRNIFHVPLPGS